jgi:hypothetical protein
MNRLLPGLALAAASLPGLHGTATAAPYRPVHVEAVAPATPYGNTLRVHGTPTSIGPGATGQLAIGSLTITNYDGNAQQVALFAPVLAAGATCGGAIVGGGNPQMTLYVPARTTLHLPFPVPMVMRKLNNQSCLAAVVTTPLNSGSVDVNITGFVQPSSTSLSSGD